MDKLDIHRIGSETFAAEANLNFFFSEEKKSSFKTKYLEEIGCQISSLAMGWRANLCECKQ